jgi:hypothetical protein
MPEAGGEPPELLARPDRGRWMWTTRVPLAYPQSDARRLATLKGRLSLSIVSKSQALEVADLSVAHPELKVQSLRFGFDALRTIGRARGYMLTIIVFRDEREDDDWNEVHQLANDPRGFKVFDDAGQRLRPKLDVTDADDNQTYSIHLRFLADGAAAAKPVRLVWELPVEVSDVQVPVELKDLPLP